MVKNADVFHNGASLKRETLDAEWKEGGGWLSLKQEVARFIRGSGLFLAATLRLFSCPYSGTVTHRRTQSAARFNRRRQQVRPLALSTTRRDSVPRVTKLFFPESGLGCWLKKAKLTKSAASWLESHGKIFARACSLMWGRKRA